MKPACMPALYFAAMVLLMQSQSDQEKCELDLTAYVLGTAS